MAELRFRVPTIDDLEAVLALMNDPRSVHRQIACRHGETPEPVGQLYDRLDAIGLVKESTFRIPLTQEVFADALGLSVVHINRTLQQLRREGMLTVGRGTVTLHQRHKLATFACYQSDAQQTAFERPVRRAGAVRD